MTSSKKLKAKPAVPAAEPEYFRDALEAIVGKTCRDIPLPQYYVSEMQGCAWVDKLQDWCALNSKPGWATGLSMMEAAELIVQQAVDNANIPPPTGLLTVSVSG